MPSFLPEGPISLSEHLSPKAQKLLAIVGCSEAAEGGAITEARFREALAADACGAQVFAQGMKLFLTVRFVSFLGVWGVRVVLGMGWLVSVSHHTDSCIQHIDLHFRTCAPWRRSSSTTSPTSTRAKSSVARGAAWSGAKGGKTRVMLYHSDNGRVWVPTRSTKEGKRQGNAKTAVSFLHARTFLSFFFFSISHLSTNTL